MISIGAFFGPEFNQNGDLAHLELISRAISRDSQILELLPDARDAEELSRLDFLVVGDASRAHHRNRADSFHLLHEIIAIREKAGRHTLVVGSSYEKLANSVFGLEPKASLSRVSKFASVSVGDKTYWGYINSDLELPTVSFRESTIGTQFFGPFLARNPWLLRQVVLELGCVADSPYINRLESLMRSSPNFEAAMKSNVA